MAKPATQHFASLDPDLPSIAARAAVEVDALLASKNVGHKNLARLADVMVTAFGQESPTANNTKRFLDPIATDVMLRTLHDARPAELTTYDALRTASLDLAERLRQTDSVTSNDALRDLKTFCLALSRHALATSYHRNESSGANAYKR